MGKSLRGLMGTFASIAMAMSLLAVPALAEEADGQVLGEDGALTAMADEAATAVARVTSGGTSIEYETLAQAIAAAQSGDCIQLLSTISNQGIQLSMDVTLDLNGYDIDVGTAAIECTSGSMTITNSAEAPSTIMGTGTHLVRVGADASVTIEGKLSIWNKGSDESCVGLLVDGGEAIVKGGSIICDAESVVGAVVVRGGSSSLLVSGGTLFAYHGTYGILSEVGSDPDGGYGSVTVTGGAILGREASIGYGTGGASKISVSGGLFSHEIGDELLADGCRCIANTDYDSDYDSKDFFPFEVVDTSEPFFNGHSLLLTGQVVLQFLVELPEGKAPADYPGAYVTFAGNKVDGSVKHYLAGATQATDDTNRYVFEIGLSSIQMADLIRPTLHYSVSGEEKTLVGGAYCVRDYLQWGFENLEEDYAIDVVNALDYYGFQSQRYCSRQNGWTIGEAYAEYQPIGGSSEVDIDNAKNKVESVIEALDENGSGSPDFHYRLVFGATLTLDMRFNAVDAEDDISVLDDAGEFKEFSRTVSGGYTTVSIADIPASRYDKMYTVYTVNSLNGSNSEVHISPAHYIYAGLSNDASSEEFKLLLAALYNYGEACKAYLDSVQ